MMACCCRKDGEPPADEQLDQNGGKVEEDENQGIPVDSGFGWVISVCVFLNIACMLGFSRSMSVLYLDLAQEFDQSATVISLVFSFGAMAACIFSMLTSNVIMVRYSVRRIATVAAACNALGTIALSQSPNIIMFLMFQLIKGSMFGCLLVCPISLIGHYFKKRRNLALAIANSGFCVAFIIFPPITAKLRSEYGLRGCLLLLAAFEIHLVAVNMLLRPPNSYVKMHRHRMKSKSIAAEPLLPEANHKFVPSEKSKSVDCGKTVEDGIIHAKTPLIEDCDNQNLLSVSQTTSNIDAHKGEESSNHNSSRHTNFASSNGQGQIAEFKTKTIDASSSVGNSKMFLSNLVKEQDIRGSQLSLCTHDEVPWVASRMSLSSTKMFESDHKLAIQRRAADESSNDNEEKVKGTASPWWTKLIDLTLFRSWMFRMIAIFIPISSALNYLIIYMPVIAQKVGLSKDDAALYMTICGVIDLTVRIVIGFVADMSCVSKAKMVAASLLALTILCHTARFFLSEDTFLVFAIVVGVFGGFRQNLMASMITDYVGVQKMAKGYAFGIMLTALFLSSNHPVIGAMIDATGDIMLPLHYIGIWLLISTVFITCEPLFAYLERKKQERENPDSCKDPQSI